MPKKFSGPTPTQKIARWTQKGLKSPPKYKKSQKTKNLAKQILSVYMCKAQKNHCSGLTSTQKKPKEAPLVPKMGR